MSDPSTNSVAKFGAADIVLFIVAVLGVWGYIFLLPDHHLDSTARYTQNEEGVIGKADNFLNLQGYFPQLLVSSARLERNALLLTSLQEDIGRTRTIEVLKSDEGKGLPGYAWVVSYNYESGSTSTLARLNEQEPIFVIRTTLSGVIWSFENNLPRNPDVRAIVSRGSQTISRDALLNIFSVDDSLDAATRTRLRAVSDSTFRANISFSGVLNGLDNPSGELLGPAALLRRLESDQKVELDSLAVLEIARYYQPKDTRDNIGWRIDSLHVPTNNSDRTARVRLVSADSVFRQVIQIDLQVSALGGLESMEVAFNPDRQSDDVVKVTLVSVKIGAYLILAILFIVVFFRRITARLIDVRTALIDAVVIGILFGIFAVLSIGSLGDGSFPIWIQIGMLLILFSIIAGATSLFVFMVSAVSESAAREVWPEKWLSLILLRKGDARNTSVGWSIVRGIGLAGALIGLGVLSLVISSSLVLEQSNVLATDASLRPILSAIIGNTGFGYLTMMILLVGIGSYTARLVKNPVVTVLAIVLVSGITQIAPYGLSVGWVTAIVSGTAGLFLALSLLRYDFLTTCLGFIIARIFWSLSEGFLIADSPVWLDATLAVLLLGLFGIVGFVGVFSGRSGGDVKQFLPEYITEMAGQERVKRELEIAHQVQGSFLPRQMPRVNGLDIAGMCLPATEVGGDYFDFIELGQNRLAFVVGDVSGKGIEAAFYMTLVKGVIQTLSRSVDSPAEVMRRTNLVFRKNAPPGTFISMIYGVVDADSKTFTFSRAGHNPAILKRNNAPEAEPLQPRGMAIGFTDGAVFDDNIEEVSIQLSPGDALVFYTDGFSEAMNSGRELYGDDRIVEKVAHVGSKTSGAILRALTEDVHHFIEGAGRSDDMTMVVIKMVI